MDVPQPDEKSIITYVSSLYDAMPRVPEVQDGVKANVSRATCPLPWQLAPDMPTTHRAAAVVTVVGGVGPGVAG